MENFSVIAETEWIAHKAESLISTPHDWWGEHNLKNHLL